MSKSKIFFLFITIIALIVVIAIYNYQQLPEPNDIAKNNDLPVGTISQSSKIIGPKITVTPESFDLGIVKFGDVPEKIITVKNIGSETLEINRLSTSCGCTQAFIDDEDKIIAPGQSVEMLVTFNPAVHKDDTDLGELTRIIYLKTNDPTQPEVEVELQANVIKISD